MAAAECKQRFWFIYSLVLEFVGERGEEESERGGLEGECMFMLMPSALFRSRRASQASVLMTYDERSNLRHE